MQGGLQLTCAAVSTGIGPPTSTDLLSTWSTGVVSIAIVCRHTVRCTVAAIVIWVTSHPEAHTDPDSVSVGVAIECVLSGPGWAYSQVVLNVNVIHFVVIASVFVPNLDIKLKSSLWGGCIWSDILEVPRMQLLKYLGPIILAISSESKRKIAQRSQPQSKF